MNSKILKKLSSLKSRTNRFHHVLQRNLQSRVMTKIVQLNKISADRCQKFDAPHRTRHKLLLQDLKNIHVCGFIFAFHSYRIQNSATIAVFYLHIQ